LGILGTEIQNEYFLMHGLMGCAGISGSFK
jgi:hypothetical protein